MMKKLFAATTAAMLCTTAGTCAYAQDDERGGWRSHGVRHRMHQDNFGDPSVMLEMLTRHLDLDDAQVQSISDIIDAARPEIDALRERAEAARKAMHELEVSDADYYGKLSNLSVEIGTVTSEATLLHGRLRAEVFAQLTPEQQERAAEAKRGMRERFHHRGPGRWHHRPGEETESK